MPVLIVVIYFKRYALLLSFCIIYYNVRTVNNDLRRVVLIINKPKWDGVFRGHVWNVELELVGLLLAKIIIM